ncbi:hypothetical protein DMENIID0001_050890 [Sergentomyia squamirostris]
MASAQSENFTPEKQENAKEDDNDVVESSAVQLRDRGRSDEQKNEEEKMYLVEEATLTCMPEHMKILLGRLPDGTFTPDILLEALLYLLIVECGFAQRDHSCRSTWSHGVTYSCPRVKELAANVSLQWFTPTQFGSFRENHFHYHTLGNFTLITFRIADTLCATFTQQSHRGYSISLSVSRYIPLVNRQNIQRSFRNLPELSRRIKNKLILPARDVSMQLASYFGSSYPSLLGAPLVPLNKILRHLPKSSMNALRELCRTSSRLQYFCALIEEILSRVEERALS